MNDIVMPKLSDTMTEGRLVSWKKRVGDTISRGDVLAEVETDKANMELEAYAAGVLLEIKVQPGEMVPVGTVIATIGKPEEKGAAPQPAQKVEPATRLKPGEAPPQPEQKAPPQPQTAQPEAPRPQAAQPQPPQPEAKGAPQEAPPQRPAALKEDLLAAAEQPGIAPQPHGEGVGGAPPGPAGAKGEEQPPPTPPAGAGGEEGEAEPPSAGLGAGAQMRQPGAAPAEGREKAAPVVRRRARELGIDLSQVQGSGPDGRILLHDVERYQPAPVQAPPAGAAQPPVAGGEAPAAAKAPAEEGVKPLPRLRAAIAKTVSESWRTIPHFTVTMDIEMDNAESIRQQLKQTDHPATLNDMIVKAVSLVLPKFPLLNSSVVEGGMRNHPDINIGVAVGVRDGVLIPVIRGCQNLSLSQISQQSRKLAERARAGALSEQEMGGGTFSVSNMGMFGISHFTAIIYPNQTGVLAVGAVADTVVVRNGAPACAKVMKVTLGSDHRLVDGVYAAEFLVELKKILENPVRLLV